jgi:hypothetical protein
MSGMPDNSDDFDEPDVRQPVVDVDLADGLSQLESSIKYIAGELEQLNQIGRVLDEIGHMLNELQSTLRNIQFRVSACLLMIIAGIVVLVGTLRHWF